MLGRAALERHPPKASVAPGRSRSTAAPPPEHHCPQWLGMAMNGVGLRRTEEPPPAIAVKSRPGLAIGDRALLFVDRVHLWCRSVRIGLALPPAEHRVVLLRSPRCLRTGNLALSRWRDVSKTLQESAGRQVKLRRRIIRAVSWPRVVESDPARDGADVAALEQESRSAGTPDGARSRGRRRRTRSRSG